MLLEWASACATAHLNAGIGTFFWTTKLACVGDAEWGWCLSFRDKQVGAFLTSNARE